jgi:hypothetical protein
MRARTSKGWTAWGHESERYYPSWPTYANHSQAGAPVGD